MAKAIVAAGYRLEEATRLSLLPLPPPAAWLESGLNGLEATNFSHPEICAGTPRNAALRILRRDADRSLAAAGGDYFADRSTA